MNRKLRSFVGDGLFWRTFFLITLLISASLMIWVESVRVLERKPYAQRIALQLASIVTLTRAAVRYVHPSLRTALLRDIEQNEGVNLYSRAPNDVITVSAKRRPLSQIIDAYVRQYLGANTVIARVVNAKPGLWISFKIGDTGYWAVLDRTHLNIITDFRWLHWALISLGLSLLGAAFITYFVNRPFSHLAHAALQIGAGGVPAQLSERGWNAIAQTNRSFNQMARNLQQLEKDRIFMLASISHDLRTPLTRLRLEVEINSVDTATQQAMIADIEQMNTIINSFLDYARPASHTLATVDLAALVRQTAARLAYEDSMEITLELTAPAIIQADSADLRRVLDNVLENARKYGRCPEDDIARVSIAICIRYGQIEVSICDRGPGLVEDQLEHATRSFYRGSTARSQADGAGLGMAIVQRLVSRYHGTLQLRNRCPGPGLEVRLAFPVYRDTQAMDTTHSAAARLSQ